MRLTQVIVGCRGVRYLEYVAKAVEQLEQVTIRFAGDSGDGMQLTGGRSRRDGRHRQRPLDAPRLPGGDPRSRGLASRRVRLPDPLRRPRHPYAGRPARRARGHEPGGAEDERRRPRSAARSSSTATPSAIEPRRRRATRRTRSRTGRSSLRVHSVPLSTMTVEALKEVEGITPREAERSKNFFALGLMSWLYGRPTETTLDFIETKFARAGARRGQHARVQGGLQLRRDERDFIVSLRGAAGEARAGRLPQHHGQPGAVARSRRRRVRVGSTSSSARTRSRPPPASSRSSPATSTSGPHVPGRGRDRGSRRRARRLVRRLARRHDVEPARGSCSSRRPSGWRSRSSCRS